MDAYTLTTQPNTDAFADAEITGAGAAIEVAIFTVPVANATSRGPTRAAFAALVVPVESAAGVVAVSGAFRLTARTRAGEAEAAPAPAPTPAPNPTGVVSTTCPLVGGVAISSNKNAGREDSCSGAIRGPQIARCTSIAALGLSVVNVTSI